MAFLGKQSPAEIQRIERFKTWASERSPYALVSVLLGSVGLLDAFTVVLGLVLGSAAVATGIAGLRDLNTKPGLTGRRFCYAGICLGATAILSSAVIGLVIYR